MALEASHPHSSEEEEVEMAEEIEEALAAERAEDSREIDAKDVK